MSAAGAQATWVSVQALDALNEDNWIQALTQLTCALHGLLQGLLIAVRPC
jgi:hypothetical protein